MYEKKIHSGLQELLPHFFVFWTHFGTLSSVVWLLGGQIQALMPGSGKFVHATYPPSDLPLRYLVPPPCSARAANYEYKIVDKTEIILHTTSQNGFNY